MHQRLITHRTSSFVDNRSAYDQDRKKAQTGEDDLGANLANVLRIKLRQYAKRDVWAV